MSWLKDAEKITIELETGHTTEMPAEMVADRLSYLVSDGLMKLISTSTDEQVMGFLGSAYSRLRDREWDAAFKTYVFDVLRSIREGLAENSADEEKSS